MYAEWIDRWETLLATRDQNRVVRPFEWGLDWLGGQPTNGQPGLHLEEHVARMVADSDSFFSYRQPNDYRLRDDALTFTSPVRSPFDENNRVFARWFPAGGPRRRAVLVLPQWNASEGSHLGLCRLLSRFGIAALRMSLAYHDRRMPGGLGRADYHVSSNLGRTIHATRQSVVDSRSCLDWLFDQGYENVGILGTSLGSCVAFLVTAHDRRIRTAVFNHCSMYFSDVVWTGLSCRHIQKTLHAHITQEQLRRFWAVISPATYLDRLPGRALLSLLIWARHDTTFPPADSLRVVEGFRERGLRFQQVVLPCGHYTSGRFPFSLWDGLAMSRFLRREL